MTSPVNALYTVGYEGLSIQEFLDILNDHAIEVLIDVRELPLSRKPGFSKTKLSQALEEVGIEYYHAKPLGAPKPIRKALKADGDWEAYKQAYDIVLDERLEELDTVREIAEKKRATLMCFEHDYSVCHRSLVADRLIENGMVSNAKHLRAPRKATAAHSS